LGKLISIVMTDWDPRMRAQIMAHIESGGAGLDPEALEAIRLLRPPSPASPEADKKDAQRRSGFAPLAAPVLDLDHP